MNEETLALATIAEQGPEGDYLSSDHTVRHFRENWMPALFDRNHFEGWAAAGARSLGARASQRVEEVLAEHKPAPLPPEARRKIQDILG